MADNYLEKKMQEYALKKKGVQNQRLKDMKDEKDGER